MNSTEKENMYFIAIALVLGFIYFWVTESKKAEMLSKNTKIDYGFFQTYRKIGRGHEFNYSYFVKGKKFILSTRHGEYFLQKKDTVLLKYSLKDPTYCELEDAFYMKKYKRLRTE